DNAVLLAQRPAWEKFPRSDSIHPRSAATSTNVLSDQSCRATDFPTRSRGADFAWLVVCQRFKPADAPASRRIILTSRTLASTALRLAKLSVLASPDRK